MHPFGLCGHIRVYREPNTTEHGESVCIYGAGNEARDSSVATHQDRAGVPGVFSLSAQACRPSTHRAHTFRTKPACDWSASLTELIKITHKSPEQTLSVELPPQKEYGATTRQIQHIDVFRGPNRGVGAACLYCSVLVVVCCAARLRSVVDGPPPRRHVALCRNKM